MNAHARTATGTHGKGPLARVISRALLMVALIAVTSLAACVVDPEAGCKANEDCVTGHTCRGGTCVTADTPDASTPPADAPTPPINVAGMPSTKGSQGIRPRRVVPHVGSAPAQPGALARAI
jgi:hypothetical protein